MTDQEREQHISDCGKLMVKAYNEGDTEAARVWLQLQNTAIRGRNQAQVDRMEGCYFCDEGDRIRAGMGAAA